jgi:hypothetical protein
MWRERRTMTMEIDKHKVRAISKGLQKTLGLKVTEYKERCPDDSRTVTRAAPILSKRLGKLLDDESWTGTKLLEISTITFLMAVATEQLGEEEEVTNGDAFDW